MTESKKTTNNVLSKSVPNIPDMQILINPIKSPYKIISIYCHYIIHIINVNKFINRSSPYPFKTRRFDRTMLVAILGMLNSNVTIITSF